MMRLLRRIGYLLQRGRLERDLECEMEAHREVMGEPARFGSMLRLREEAREAWGWGWLDRTMQDVRHGMRILRKRPLYAVTAVAVLGVGIGLNLALAQVLNAVAWKPMMLRDPDGLVRFFRLSPNSSSSGVPYQVARYAERNRTALDAVILVQTNRVSWGEGDGQPAAVSFVSGNFFAQMGKGVRLGRLFQEGDERGVPVAVVSHQFWSSRLNGDVGMMGSVVTVNGVKATLIGVAAEGFHGPVEGRCDAWLLMEQMDHYFPGSRERESWTSNNVNMYGRLQPGVGVQGAEDAMRGMMRELAGMYPQWFAKDEWLGAAAAGDHFRRAQDRQMLLTVAALLGGLSLMVLLVACANVAGLGVAHAAARGNEFRMRTALGAGRARLLRQLVTESAVLSMSGVVFGWFVGYGLSQWLCSVTEFDTPMEIVPSGRMMGLAMGLGWVTALAVGLIPAWRVTRQNGAGMREHGVASGRAGWTQRALLGAQTVGTCVLLVVTALTARKLERLVAADFGFRMEGVAVVEAALLQHGFVGEQGRQYWTSLRSVLEADPRVAEVTVSSVAPLGRTVMESRYNDAPGIKVTHISVEPEFFGMMRIPLLRGRNFERGDTRRTAVIVGQRLAERMYGSVDVVGRGFPVSEPEATIVGVAANATLIKITATDVSELYHPLETGEMAGAVLLARLRDGVGLDKLRDLAARADGRVRPQARWMAADFERKLQGPRLMWEVSRNVGAFAVVLSAVGIFGLVAYTVSLRTREIGVRVALGAGARQIAMLVVGGLMLPVGVGSVVGIAIGTLGLGRLLAGDPFYLDPREPVAIGGVVAVLVVSAMAAAAGPVQRALRIDPAAALRGE